MSYRDEVMADSPRIYLRLEETSGTNANDETANNLDGTYVNTPTLGVTGAISSDVVSNKAVSLNGTNEYVSVPDNNLLDVGDIFSIECWFKRSAISTDAALFDKGNLAPYILLGGSDNKIYLYKGGAGSIAVSTVAVTDTTTWHHLVVTKNGTTTRIYLDGIDVTGATVNLTLGNSTSTIRWGVKNNGFAYFPGSLDEVALYPTALSLSRAQAHYNVAVNHPPYVPSNLDPSGNEGVASGVLSADVSDPDGDAIASVTIELYDETAVAYVTGYTDVSPQVVTTGLEDGVMTKDATSVLTVGHNYRWRAKASDGSLTSAFSAWSYFTYGVAPVVVLTEPDPAEVITTAGLPITFTYSHVNAKIADRVLLQKLTGSSYVTSYDSGWVGTEGSPQNRTSITLPTGTLRNQESYQIKVFAKASGGFEGDTGFVEFSVAYTGPAALTPTATPSASRAEVFLDWPTSALADVDFAGYEVAVGDPAGTVSTANKTIVFYTSDKTLSQYTYPYPISGESKGYYVRQIQVIGPDLVEGNWTRVTATCDFGDRIFIKSVADPYTLLFDFEVLRRSLPSQSKTASQQFIRTWGRAVPVELLGEGREATGSIDIPFYDSATFAQSAAARAAIFEQIEAIRGTVALLLSVPTKRKEFVAIEGEVTLELDDNLKYRASLNWRRVDYSEDYYV